MSDDLKKIKNNYEVLVLGSGTSTGIPMVGCQCQVCKSPDPRDKRLRTSFLITTKNNKKVLIDMGADLRTQILNHKVDHIDYAFLTHEHADHLHGIDDLRPFCFGPPIRSINIYSHQKCIENVSKRFDYIFDKTYFSQDKPIIGGGIPRLEFQLINTFMKEIEIEGEKYTFLLLPHGHVETLGIIYEKVAILVDFHLLSEDQLNFLNSLALEALFVDCVKEGNHQTHLTLDKSMDYIARIGAKQSFLIHMGHKLSHEYLIEKCKNAPRLKCLPAYDGLIVSL